MTAGLSLLDGVRWDDVDVPGERLHALLAALALEPMRVVSDSGLVELVWGIDEAPANPTKALQVLVSRARAKTTPDAVVRSGHGYRLGSTDLDAVTLRDHVAAARSALTAGDLATARDQARAALALTVTQAASDSGPLSTLRSAAHAQKAQARVVLGRALSGLGEHQDALLVLEAAVAEHPADEILLESLLRSEAATRGAPAALDRYERHRTAVREATGSDPGPALQRLQAELLVLDRPVREGLLEDSSRLIGRDEDVVALAATLRTSRVTSIVGPGGLGKTRLAHLMGRLATQPVVHFVELAGVTSPDGVAVEVGAVLGVRESVANRRLQAAAERHDLHARILERIGGIPSLLILDNCEHVVGAVAELVAVLVARSPQLRVLTTTRAPLGLAAERVYTLATLGRDDAVELFRERATSARPDVRLDDRRVATLVERLDGLPLAVELAAAKVRVMSVEEIERRLEDRFALLRGGSRDAPERHQTLLAVIDWSWNLLDDSERVAMRRLSAFRDGFSLEGAGAVVGLEDALAVVTTLVDQSLVTVHESQETVRYRLLETVREFSRMQLDDAGDDQYVERRLRAWAVALATRTEPRLFSWEQVDTMSQMRVEEGNLTDVLRRALADRDAATVIPVMAALASFWTVEGTHLKVVNVAAPVEDVVADTDPPTGQEDALRWVLATVSMNTMIFAGAPSPRSLARLRALGPGTGEPRIRGMVVVLLAISESDGFGHVDALDELCRDPDRAVVRTALQWTSQAKENAGDVDGALAAARSALALCDDAEGPWNRALLTSQLAGLAVQIGDNTAGRRYTEAALADMTMLGAVEDVMQLKSLLAMLEINAGRLDEADRLLTAIGEEDRHQSFFGGTLVMHCGAAEVALAKGDTELGLRRYREAVTSLRQVTSPMVDVPTGFVPWVLFPESGALSAHARAGAWDELGDLRDDLLARVAVLLADERGFLDYPVCGAAMYALAAWDLSRDESARWEPAVQLLVHADVFAYNRLLPSLSWDWAAGLAETRLPGMLASYRAELGDRTAVELRDQAGRLVAELG